MPSRRVVLATFVGVALLARGSAGDVWDTGGVSAGDNTRGSTRNELYHGSEQIHDFAAIAGAADHDWFRLSLKPFSSYEVVVDGTTGGIGPPVLLQLTDSAGINIKTSSGVSAGGYSRTLTFYNDTGTVIDNRYIHTASAGCTTACTSNDVYRIRFFDTTLDMARFNNIGTQETYMILTNPTDYTIKARAFFIDPTGTCVCKTSLLTLTKRTTAVMDDDGIGGSVTCPDSGGVCAICQGDGSDTCGDPSDLGGLAGHAMVISDGRFGDLSGKGSALDPAGALWEFDTEMPARPY